MIRIYAQSSNTSLRKARAFFEEHGLPYEEKKFSQATFGEIVHLVKLADGIENLIATKSKHYPAYAELLEDKNASLFELYYFAWKHPTLIRAPLIVSEDRFNIGYNVEEINAFLPRSVKNAQRELLLANLDKERHLESKELEGAI